MRERGPALDILIGLQRGGSYAPPGHLAILYAAPGDSEQAFAALERAYAEHSPSLQFLKVDPACGPLRSDPRLTEIVRRVGLPR
jgi:hypothetical protein